MRIKRKKGRERERESERERKEEQWIIFRIDFIFQTGVLKNRSKREERNSQEKKGVRIKSGEEEEQKREEKL